MLIVGENDSCVFLKNMIYLLAESVDLIDEENMFLRH